MFGQYYTPSSITKVVAKLAEEWKSQRILDPSCGAGDLLASVSSIRQDADIVGIEPNADAAKQADETLSKVTYRYKILKGDFLLDSWDYLGEFDLIVCSPPFGINPQKVSLLSETGPLEVQDNPSHLIILKSCLRLTEKGAGLFVVSTGFVDKKRQNAVFANLSRFGLCLQAYIAVPAGTFAPYTSIPTALVLIQKGKSNRIFVGEMSQDTGRNQSLLNNLITGKEGKEIASGKLVTTENFIGYQSLAAEERIERLAKRLGLAPILLGDVVKEINLTKAIESPGFDERTNAVYLPLIGRSNAVPSLSELTMKPHNYVQLVIDTEKADAGYVAGFLNTTLGHAIRESCYSGAVIPKITKSSLTQMQLYLPNRKIQIETIEADIQIKNLVNELQELRDQVWSRPNQLINTRKQLTRVNREERFVDWLDTLPFPLASVLWAYNAAKGNLRLRYDYLDHFFEALAEFLATLLLSGFANNEELFSSERVEIRRILNVNRLSLEMSTFGTWVKLCERLSKQAREMAHSQERYKCKQMFYTSDDDVLQAFLSSRLIGILQDTNNLRNEWRGHGGAASDQLVREREVILQNYLNGVRGCIGDMFTRYQLIMPHNMSLREGIFQINAYSLMGTRTPFESTELFSNAPLEADRLYMMGQEERSALKLLPLFMIKASPESAQNACYFYNRKQKDGLRFISYHFDVQAEIVESALDTIKALDYIKGNLENSSSNNSSQT